MNDPNEKEQHTKPNKTTPPSVTLDDTQTKPSVQEAEASYNPTNDSTKKPSIIKRVVTPFVNKKNQAVISNIISFGMFIATVVLAIYTYKVFKQTTQQSIAALKADSIAQDALNTSKRYNDSVRKVQQVLQAKSDIADAKKLKIDTDFINKQKAGINAQIKSLEVTQKEFEIENRPFMVISNIKLDTPSIGKRMNFSALIVNSGKQPALIKDAKWELYTLVDSNYTDMGNITDRPDIKNTYLPYNQTIPITGFTNFVFDKVKIDFIKKNKLFVYFKFDFTYTGIGKGNIYEMKVMYRLGADFIHSFKTVHYDIK